MPHSLFSSLPRIGLFSFLLLLVACQPGPQRIEISGKTMGTTFNIVAVDKTGNLKPEIVKASVEEALVKVNQQMSNWDPASEISRFNAAQTIEPMSISKELSLVMKVANLVHSRSEGKFDVTLGPLIDLWGFGSANANGKAPSDVQIAQALKKVGQARVLTFGEAPSTLAKIRPDVSVYLASLAKGYGIDAISDVLKELGIEDFLVEIGGDLFASGVNIQGAIWRIGIEKPERFSREIEDIVEVKNLGMATSGDYRNYYEENGIRYSHIIDAQTGKPITHRTASVTVLAESAMLADAWATALLALGLERGKAISEKFDLAALFIFRNSSMDDTEFLTYETLGYKRLKSSD